MGTNWKLCTMNLPLILDFYPLNSTLQKHPVFLDASLCRQVCLCAPYFHTKDRIQLLAPSVPWWFCFVSSSHCVWEIVYVYSCLSCSVAMVFLPMDTSPFVQPDPCCWMPGFSSFRFFWLSWTACRILVPRSGIELEPLAVRAEP